MNMHTAPKVDNVVAHGMDNNNSDKTIALSTIWQELLGREQIGVEQNFFELGGNASLAAELFHKIQKVFGRRLPPMAIYQAPTIASLAAQLDARNWPPFPRCIQMNSGDQACPVFLIHGLGGNILEFFDFVRSLETPRAIYGLQARGTDGAEAPCSSIEEMAHFHAEAIKALQPRGPYILVGYSLGGLVALEMARYFSEIGDNVSLLVMIDSYPALQFAPLGQRLGVYSRKFRHYASRLIRLAINNRIPHVSRRSDQSQNALQADVGHAEFPAPVGIAFTPAMRLVQEGAMNALKYYKPRPYPGRIRFVQAASALHFPEDPEKVWSKFVGQFEVETVLGDHHELLTTHFQSLANVISRYLLEFR